jgi:hypothetical protein
VSAIDFTPFLVIPFLIAVVGFIVWQVRAYHVSEHETRTDQRIPAEEIALTGLDYRVHAAPFFRRRRHFDQIIAETCGAELPSPNTNRGDAATTARPTTKGDTSNGAPQ